MDPLLPDSPRESAFTTVSRHVPLWLLACVTLSGTVAMHIFVPALPHAAEELHASAASMQMTLSLYILGLAFGQLFYGPIADRFGRRPTLMGGLVLYMIAGLAAGLATGATSLIAARLFQALGGCAGLVIARAVVRDTAPPAEATRRLAVMNLMVTLGPGVAPLIGGLLADVTGWRSIFLLLVALGAVNLLFVWRLMPETNPPGVNSDMRALARNYGLLLRSPAFYGFSIGGGCATTSLYAFIAAAPFIFAHQLGRPTHEAGIYLALLVSGVWLGSVTTSRLIAKVSMVKLMVRANLLSVLAAGAFLLTVVTGNLSVAGTIACLFLFSLGVGMAAPPALALSVSVQPKVIGSASGLYGFIQMAVGAICTALAGLGDDPALAAGIVLAVSGLVAQFSFWLALRQTKTA
jgi:DHA1 family bicyclomycin/chloramphenicol resistance-like MFS transporter